MTGVEIRLPELTGGTEAAQLRQIQSYLYTLAQQLQYAFDGVSREQENVQREITAAAKKQDTVQNFGAIKSLIIRSAEITERLAEKMEMTLAGKFVAQSQFGTFTQLTEQRIAAGAEELRQEFSNVQQIESRMEGIESALLDVSACIRTGMLYEREDGPVYGVEIGQQERENGVVRFRKFTRLTADRLSFYDSNDVEVAYISDRCLHVTDAQVYSLTAESASVMSLRMGEYLWQIGADGHLSLR